jgi:hypothetical protein
VHKDHGVLQMSEAGKRGVAKIRRMRRLVGHLLDLDKPRHEVLAVLDDVKEHLR